MTKTRSIHVALDTNILHSKSPHFFVNKSLSAFIKNNKDVQIKWYLPSVVKAEREHQITIDTAELLNSVEAIERLLDEKLHVSKEKLNSAIRRRINKQIKDHELIVVELDPDRINWNELIKRAVSRQAPFEKARESEKGFRDALILETFDQLHNQIKPKASRRLILMSADDRLLEAIKERFAGRKNVLITSELAELKTSLSALRANITQEAAEILADKAHILFLGSGEPRRAINSIREKFATVLPRGPMASDKVNERGVSVNETSFLGKDGSRSEFSTVISVLVDALRLHYYTPTVGYGDMYPTTGYGNMYRMSPEILSHRKPGMPLSYRESQELSHRVSQQNVTQLKIPGQHLFNVTWSAEETQEGKLGNLVVEDIEYESTIWNEP